MLINFFFDLFLSLKPPIQIYTVDVIYFDEIIDIKLNSIKIVSYTFFLLTSKKIMNKNFNTIIKILFSIKMIILKFLL